MDIDLDKTLNSLEFISTKSKIVKDKIKVSSESPEDQRRNMKI